MSLPTPVAELQALIADQPRNPLRPHQIEALETERKAHEGMARAPDWQGADKGQATTAIRRIDAMLAKQAPKPIEGPRRDLVATKVREVLETVIKPAMLPKEVMRRNPDGAVDEFRRREGSTAYKAAALAVKAALRGLEPTNDDLHYTNLERFRPTLEGAVGLTATFAGTGQIPGHLAMTPQAKANWPLGGPTVKTALDGAGYVPPEAEPEANKFSSYQPEADQQARKARAAGLATTPRQCQADGCATFFEASTKTPNPRRYCDAHRGHRWQKRTKAAPAAAVTEA